MIPRFSKQLLLMAAFLLNACATPYQGPTPDFSLRGEQGQTELNRFLLKEDVDGFSFENDPHQTPYTASSMRPLIEFVSPDAVQNIERSSKWTRWQLYTFGLGIAGLIAGHSAKDHPTKSALYAASTLASMSSVGISFYASSIGSRTPSIYNEDLRRKFNISLGAQYRF